jgi:hypothetical protein
MDFFDLDWTGSLCNAIGILDAKYKKVSTDDVVDQLEYLNPQQKEDLKAVMKDYGKLFSGTLGVYPHIKFHIDLIPGAKAKHARPYPVPIIHMETFKKKLLHEVDIGVLSAQGASEWASPTFIIPKKDGRVRWVSDLRELTKVVQW